MLLLILDEPAEKIRNMLQKKKVEELYDKKMMKDLIVAEFKYPDRWRKDTMKDDRETSVAGGEVTSFEKVVDYIEYCCL